VAIRRWDDRGKVVGLVTPTLADYGAQIEALHAEVTTTGTESHSRSAPEC
jgi:hypothetical protein